MNTQKGFSSLLGLLLFISLVGGGLYFYIEKTSKDILIVDTTSNESNPVFENENKSQKLDSDTELARKDTTVEYLEILSILEKASLLEYYDSETGLSFLYPDIFSSSPKSGSFRIDSKILSEKIYNTPILAVSNTRLSTYKDEYKGAVLSRSQKVYYDENLSDLIRCDWTGKCESVREGAIKTLKDGAYISSCLICLGDAGEGGQNVYNIISPKKDIIYTVVFDLSFYPPGPDKQYESIIKQMNNRLFDFRKKFEESLAVTL